MGNRARVESVLAVLGIKFELKEVRGRLWGLCPYHQDTKASWFVRVTPDRYGQHHCFSCKQGGGLADLVSHVRGITIMGAVDWLKDFADQVPIIERDFEETIRMEVVQSAASFQPPAEFIFKPLSEWVSPARSYLVERGVTSSQVNCFRLGYAVSGRLAGRIILPTFKWAPNGTFVMQSYMARDFTRHRQAKRYLYPPSEDHPNLDVMFGEHTWPEYHRTTQTVIVTEGALNALAVDRASIHYVAALGGSDMRDVHVSKLSTFGRVGVFTDSDSAGDAIAAKLEGALERHVLVQRVRLPSDPGSGKAKDANDYSKEELETFLRFALKD